MIEDRDGSDEEVISDLVGGGRTSTPAHVLWHARSVCKAIREYLGPRKVVATIVPHGARTIIVYLRNHTGHTFTLSIVLNMAYLKFLPPPVPAGDAYAIGVPDMVEAIHFIGIVLNDVQATIVDIGQRAKERCADTLRHPLAPGLTVGPMALCDPFREPLRAETLGTGDVTCVVSMDGNYTPVEIFNWASRIAREARRKLGSRRLKGKIWGVRGVGLRRHLSHALDKRDYAAFADFSDHEESSISQRVILRLQSNPWSTYVLMFIAREKHSVTEHVCAVPCLMQSLHMMGMVLEALGASIDIVSSRKGEMNVDVLARPLEADQIIGSMVEASNFVSPLTTQYR